MSDQHPTRADRDGVSAPREDAATARAAIRMAEREEVRHGHLQQQSLAGRNLLVGSVAVLIALLSAVAVWLKS